MTDYVVGSGHGSSGIVLSPGDTMEVLSSGSAISTTVLSGGFIGAVSVAGEMDLYGTGFGEIVTAGGSQIVENGGSANNTLVSSGGIEIVSSGGLDFNASVLGEQDVSGT